MPGAGSSLVFVVVPCHNALLNALCTARDYAAPHTSFQSFIRTANNSFTGKKLTAIDDLYPKGVYRLVP